MAEPRELRYLPRADVIRASEHIDVVEVVKDALLLHARGRTTLPDEAYLGWETSDGSSARSLALPGALWGKTPAVGLKMINASLGNPRRGLPRAQGLTFVFDPETARPLAILEAAHLSTLRTAAYTVLSVRLLARLPLQRVAVIGCGPIGATHVRMLATDAPGAVFVLHDRDADRLHQAVRSFAVEGVPCEAASHCEDAVRGAGVVVTATTTTTGYLAYDWLSPGALIAHVSLDDVLEDVVRRADVVLVDDWQLVSTDTRRLLGRMCLIGDLVGPDHDRTGPVKAGTRTVDGTLGDVVAGQHPGRISPPDVILSNPFGMGILDVALAAEVVRVAERLGLGIDLPV
jgi:N-[(2S)-2-amino-2-carboxyethyl]-L-glutamate dehydrogenase